MADIGDAVTWQNLLPLSVPVLAYADGPASRWPPEALKALAGRIAGSITVLADETYSIFDAEAGDAGNPAVATAVADRFQAREVSTAYTNTDNCPDLTRALRTKGLFWTDSQFWPEPGCYLWAAAPGITPGRIPPWCPVSPVAVQDRWLGSYNLSTTFHGWPAVKAPPPLPPPPSPGEDDMFVMIRDPQGHVATFNGRDWWPVTDTVSMTAFEGAGIKVVEVTQAQFDSITKR
jgi:hypothetical protein